MCGECLGRLGCLLEVDVEVEPLFGVRRVGLAGRRHQCQHPRALRVQVGRRQAHSCRLAIARRYALGIVNLQSIVWTRLSHEESNSAANSNGRKFLYNSKGLDVFSLLVKYYVPLAQFNKVIKLLKFKSAVNLQCFYYLSNGRRNRESTTE